MGFIFQRMLRAQLGNGSEDDLRVCARGSPDRSDARRVLVDGGIKKVLRAQQYFGVRVFL